MMRVKMFMMMTMIIMKILNDADDDDHLQDVIPMFHWKRFKRPSVEMFPGTLPDSGA